MRTFAVAAVLCLVLTPCFAAADEPPAAEAPVAEAPVARAARNTVFVELLGSGVLYSVNYERFVRDDVALRFGAGIVEAVFLEQAGPIVLSPVTASWIHAGRRGHALELGGGVTFITFVRASAVTGAAASGIIGYRYAPPEGGFSFRANLTPLIGRVALPWFGLSFGRAF